MIATSEADLICDLAETYQIFDYRRMPVKLLATLCAGLRDDSRIRIKLRGEKYATDLVLKAMIVDKLTLLQHGLFHIEEKPELIMESMFGPFEREDVTENVIKPDVFNSPEEFFASYSRLTNKETYNAE